MLNNLKHTNKMTDEEIDEQIVQLITLEAHLSKEANLRLTNLRNEKKYRESLQKETICL